jgi:hypothetical protein
MEEPRCLVEPGLRPSPPHICWPIWSGGVRTITDVASPRITTNGAGAATRARWQTSGATLSAMYGSSGSRQNHPRMDGARGAHLPLAKGFRLRGTKPDVDAVSCHGEMGEGASRRTRMEPHSGERRPVWTVSSPKTGPKWVCRGLVDFSTISHGST